MSTIKSIRAIVAATLLVVAPLAFSQATQSGNIYGKVTDEQGAPLPGVSVVLRGIGANQSTSTNAQGEYRFLNVAPGNNYMIGHTISGFSGVTRKEVVVNVGKNTELMISMKLSTIQADVTVSGESPLLDTRRSTAGVTASKLELESIPSARDPWVVMQTVPGVLVDRVNIGGNESGQQSVMTNKGSLSGQAVWNVDGVNITDMTSLSSPAYYDFDSFEEIAVSTGGSDPSVQTPGVQMNLVTKRGSNDVHGAARVLITDRRWQAQNISDELSRNLAQYGGIAATNQIQGIQDYGADVGGPIVKDKVWGWGSYGRSQIDLITTGGGSDKTTLEAVNAKVNAQPIESNSATLFFSRGDKIKLGRSVGPTRPTETGWNQSGPTSVYKIEDSQVFSSNLFATALYSYLDGGFGLISQGRTQTFSDAAGIFHNSYYDYVSARPQHQIAATVSAFMRTGDIGHEFKFGFSYRNTPSSSTTAWPDGLVACKGAGSYCGGDQALITRDGVVKTKQEYYAGYLSDTLTISNLTVNVGVRYDIQQGNNDAISVPATRVSKDIYPGNILGALSVPEVSQGVDFKDFQPRLGITYALGKDSKTLLRASYAQFADQVGAGTIAYNSIAPGLAGLYYGWNDKNNNNRVDAGEVDYSELLNYYGVDPDNPTAIGSSPNKIDPDLKAQRTHEVTLGFEREVLPTLAVSLTGTYRRINDLIFTKATGLTGNDYEVKGRLTGTLPNGQTYDVPYYGLKAGVVRPGGRTTLNQPDAYQDFKGLELQLNKRYAGKWMARASIALNDWRRHFGGLGSYGDPTNLRGGSTADDGQVAPQSTGSGNKGGVFLNAKWSFNANALYSLPLGFNVAGNFFARQGYPIAYYRSVSVSGQPSGEGSKLVALSDVDDIRYGTVTNFDLRLEKVLKVGQLDFNLGADIFNVFNSNTAFQRQNNAASTQVNRILESQSARVVRFGGRISF